MSERRERLESAVRWTAKDVSRLEIVDNILHTLEEREQKPLKRRGRGLRLPYTPDDLNPKARVVLRCAVCGFKRATTEERRMGLWEAHLLSPRHLEAMARK